MQRCRHPDLDAYIGDAVSALRRPIAAGDVKRVVLAIKDDDAAASDGPLERFTFDFLLRDDDDTAGVNDTAGGSNGGGVADVNGGSAVRGPSRADVDQCSRAFAACLSKIAFSDALLTPLPQAAMNAGRLSFEIVAYSTRAGVAAQLCAGAGAGGGGSGPRSASGLGRVTRRVTRRATAGRVPRATGGPSATWSPGWSSALGRRRRWCR